MLPIDKKQVVGHIYQSLHIKDIMPYFLLSSKSQIQCAEMQLF
jgi:hypothetical protein